MNRALSNPWIGHGALIALVLLAAGALRVAYVEPRLKQLSTLRADERRLAAQITDLKSGIDEMEAWARLHPGQDRRWTGARRLPPASDMVPAFLKATVPIASRSGVTTTAVEPAGEASDVTVNDAAGKSTPCRIAELQLKVRGRYRDLGEYVQGLETMDQLVAVRPLAVRYDGSIYPELAADLVVRVYGTP